MRRMRTCFPIRPAKSAVRWLTAQSWRWPRGLFGEHQLPQAHIDSEITLDLIRLRDAAREVAHAERLRGLPLLSIALSRRRLRWPGLRWPSTPASASAPARRTLCTAGRCR